VWTGKLHVYIREINLSRIDLHVRVCFGREAEVELFAGCANRQQRQGGRKRRQRVWRAFHTFTLGIVTFWRFNKVQFQALRPAIDEGRKYDCFYNRNIREAASIRVIVGYTCHEAQVRYLEDQRQQST